MRKVDSFADLNRFEDRKFYDNLRDCSLRKVHKPDGYSTAPLEPCNQTNVCWGEVGVYNLTIAEPDNALGLTRHIWLVGNHDNGDATGIEFAKDIHYFSGCARIKCAGRFIR